MGQGILTTGFWRGWGLRAGVFALALGLATGAQAGESTLDFGGDSYRAGARVILEASRGDVFLAGRSVTIDAPLSGSAHLAGRRIAVTEPIGGNLYGAGQSVDLGAALAGNATLFGQRVDVAAPVQGNLRVGASEIAITGEVSGTAILGGESLFLDAPIRGGVMLGVDELRFGPGAQILGPVILYEDEDAPQVIPASVAAPDQIERRALKDWEGAPDHVAVGQHQDSLWHDLRAAGWDLLWLTAVVGLVAALAPLRMLDLRDHLAEAPLRSVLRGFVGLSAAVGAVIVLAMTGVGVIFAPFALVLAVLAGVAGYVIGVYGLGIGLLTLAGLPLPEALGERLIAALAGALAVVAVGLVSGFAVWLFGLILALAGLGALVQAVLRPRLFA